MGAFTTAIAEATAEVAGGYKPNCAFFEALGRDGDHALAATVDAIRRLAPDAAVVLDAKRADIRSTNDGYLQSILGLGVDCVTVHPYLGGAALASFLAQEDLVVFVSARTSNPGAGEFQDLQIGGLPLIAMSPAQWPRVGTGVEADAEMPSGLEIAAKGLRSRPACWQMRRPPGRTLTSAPAFAAGVPDLHAHGSRSPRPLIVRRDCGGCDRRGRCASRGAASASPGGRSRRGGAGGGAAGLSTSGRDTRRRSRGVALTGLVAACSMGVWRPCSLPMSCWPVRSLSGCGRFGAVGNGRGWRGRRWGCLTGRSSRSPSARAAWSWWHRGGRGSDP